MEAELKKLQALKEHLKKCERACKQTYREIFEDLIEDSLDNLMDEVDLMIEDIQDRVKQAYSSMLEE